MSGRAWRVDLAELTGADVPTVIAADTGDVAAMGTLLEKTIKPSLEMLPLTEWPEARKEMMDAIIATMFPGQKP